MQKNNDSSVVTLDVDIYRELVAMADTSARYNTKRITRHARKFNPHLQPAHQIAVLEHEAERNQAIIDTKNFFHANRGKVVYAKIKVYTNTDMSACPLLPVIVKRIGKKRWTLDVVPAHDEYAQKHKQYQPCSIEFLQIDVPDGYIQGVGSYINYLVPENGTYDTRDVEAERDRRNETHRKTLKESGCDDVRVG